LGSDPEVEAQQGRVRREPLFRAPAQTLDDQAAVVRVRVFRLAAQHVRIFAASGISCSGTRHSLDDDCTAAKLPASYGRTTS